MAKDLVRTRQYITKFIEMRSHLQGASLKLQTVKSHQAMSESMASVGKAVSETQPSLCPFLNPALLTLSSPPLSFATLVRSQMMKMNKAVDLPQITKMMQDFARENEKSELMQEMMGDAMDDAMSTEGAEEEESNIVNQVLEEIGINFDGEMAEAPSGGGKVAAQEIPEAPGGRVAAGVGVGGGGGGGGGDGKDDGPDAGGGGASDPAVSELEARLNNLRR
jgi:charged multivesicular body protein 2A